MSSSTSGMINSFMTWDTFQDLFQQLWPHLEWQDISKCIALPVDTQLALTMLKLAMLASLWYVRHLFGMGKATTREAILEVCRDLQDVLGHTVLCIHNPLAVVAGFHPLRFPQCVRALDVTHIPITYPPHRDWPYYSHRGFHSMVLLAVKDHSSTFMHVSAAWVGNTHNAHMFCNSSLVGLMENGQHPPDLTLP
ncbi:hypothetical protein Y1Q_0007774 [Alligator mississippiensis]|uniref:DDE Tnp4 domain-containing protein n=1 Tax=Alligator mississippiensis TaxID=8496 RepID=A0A151N7S6_ALLMI|nr:hypothetical protein Y1Q_0007774 [Alligator mississippiensis]